MSVQLLTACRAAADMMHTTFVSCIEALEAFCMLHVRRLPCVQHVGKIRSERAAVITLLLPALMHDCCVALLLSILLQEQQCADSKLLELHELLSKRRR
jgi:hypothetical protein